MIIQTDADISVIVAALYLRGLNRSGEPSRYRAAAALSALRSEGPYLGAAEALRTHGFWHEAIIIEDRSLLAQCEKLVEEGAILTIADTGYPDNWRHIDAPPALWCVNTPHRGPSVAIVGSRQPPASNLEWVASLSHTAVESGFEIVSGGAPGCDAIAISARSTVTVVLPCGIAVASSFLHWAGIEDIADQGATLLSAASPHEPFSRGLAMERNALIYAHGIGTIIGHSRFKEGGTWHGTVAALRRRHRVWVRREATPSVRALAALGAIPIEGFEDCLCLGQPLQPSMESLLGVR